MTNDSTRDVDRGGGAKPKLVLLGPSLNAVSGISTHVQILLASDLRNVFEISHFQCGGEGLRQSRWQRLSRILTSPFQFAVMMLQVRPQVVHINTALYRNAFSRDAVFLFLGRLLGAATVLQFHGGNVRGQSGLSKILIRVVLSASHSIVVITNEDYAFYASLTDRRSIAKIENGIPLPEKNSKAAARVRGSQLRLAHIGRLIEAKGLLDILNALRLLRERGSGAMFSLHIAGTGPLAQIAKTAVLAHGLNSSVKFLGPVAGEQLRDLLDRTDLLLLPSYSEEKLPYAILEAMALGVPAVTCAKGAIADLITNNVDGVIVPPKNPVELAAILDRLSNDHEHLNKMSLACRKRISEGYSARRMADDFVRLYRKLIRR